MNVLFITWDGPQTNYLEFLFLPIFKKLTGHGLKFHILQFTWGDKNRIEASRQACVTAGFSYQAEIIWRHPVALGSLLTALNGSRVIRKVIREQCIDVVMPRSTFPALATLLALRASSLPMIFDADGLPLDERVDFSGQSPSSFIYRFLRDIESQAVRRANIVLTRSSKAIDILHARAGAGTVFEKFHVVSNGRDANHFKPHDNSTLIENRKKLNLDTKSPLIVYAGSLGGKYCTQEIINLFSLIKEKEKSSRFLILTSATDLASKSVNQHPELITATTILQVPGNMVAQYLACADLGVSIIKPSYSMQAASAIKTGEYLLSGLPVIGTSGIGDSKKICSQAGYALDEITDESLSAAANWFVNEALPNREHFKTISRQTGEENYSLEAAAKSYANAIEKISK